jgi:hypothetical protein
MAVWSPWVWSRPRAAGERLSTGSAWFSSRPWRSSGIVTFERALQSSIEDTEYASRIALLRGYYFEQAPEIAPCLLSVAPAELLLMQRVPGDRWQGYRTVAGMVAVITGVLTGSTAALLAILIFDHSLAAAVISGAVVALPTLIAMIRHQDSAWGRAAAQPLGAGED